MSACRVDNPSEIVDVGENVWVKVIGKETKDDKLKLSFSMKLVNQGNGKDLDPNNVALDQDDRKKREFRDYGSQKIVLEAVLNTVCKKCGCKGHFSKDCFMQPGGTKYTLVPEEDEEEDREEKSKPSEEKPKKKKKEKERKRKRREKKSSNSSQDDSSDSTDEECSDVKQRKHSEKHHKSHKKKKKHKKYKHKESVK
ncbi:nucleolar protein of 40 kDa [Protopterus annectens]|uniref:nucleolar protein of 40 kDa n=1 Tax=Protopterus annectens TaxID=7888 RepID=UPI001CF940DD|nr:nucleolar protein of 40 kDa [Protopterus annectens]